MLFHDRLREIRKAAGMTQRTLAEQVGIHFTYLSKIENGWVDPPSEDTIKRIAIKLALRLSLDETALADELTILSGKIPSELAETLLRNPEVIRLLRSIGDSVYSENDWRRLFAEQPPTE